MNDLLNLSGKKLDRKLERIIKTFKTSKKKRKFWKNKKKKMRRNEFRA